MKRLAGIFLFLCCSLFSVGQMNVDSLEHALATAKSDTAKLSALYLLSEYSEEQNVLKYAQPAVDIANKLLKENHTEKERNYILHQKALALSNVGFSYRNLGNFNKALESYAQALYINQELGYKEDVANSLNSIGYLYTQHGDVRTGLDFFYKGLKVQEELGNKSEMALSLNNIAYVYYNQGETDRALEMYKRCCELEKEDKEYNGLSSSLNNIGAVYKKTGNMEKALDYYKQSLEVREKMKDQKGIAQSIQNIGIVYFETGKVDEALDWYTRSLRIRKQIDDPEGIAYAYDYIGSVYIKKAQKADLNAKPLYQKALAYCDSALRLSEQLGFPDNLRNIESHLYIIYSALGNDTKAFEHYKKFIVYRDSLENKATQNATLKSQFKYEYEKKAAADSIRVEEEKKLEATKLQHERQQKFWLYGGLVIVLIFAGFMFNRFRITQKQKKIITEQKHLVEEKQKEIIESITYAKRLQEAILPPPQFIDQHAPDNFVLYKPKDIVAGDFYWSEIVNDLFFIAAADSTGHGVPGAMVSVVCSNALNRAVKEFGLTETGRILDKTRELVLETFSKSESDVKDGMDISLLCIDRKNGKLFWSGANNPLWWISNKEMKEIKGDKQPIGKTDQPKPFTTHALELEPGAVFYLFTDGFADQFGGPKGKKFKYKQLEEILLAHAQLPMEEQSAILDEQFEKWKGALEQVDDVCIIGIRI